MTNFAAMRKKPHNNQHDQPEHHWKLDKHRITLDKLQIQHVKARPFRVLLDMAVSVTCLVWSCEFMNHAVMDIG